MSNYRPINRCLCCDSERLHGYLDLGDQPLANAYHHGEKLERFPLQVNLCKDCWHSQLSVSVDPRVMFEHYLYISDTSKTLRDYFENLAELVISRAGSGTVLEVASNSGLFLEMFLNRGCKCLGVDPAKNLKPLAEARGLEQLDEFWDLDLANKMAAEGRLFDTVLAIHVLPHVPNPTSFLLGCKRVLTPSGRIYVQTSQCDMFLNNEFDAIYHEHSSYFTASSFRRLADNIGLKVTGAWKFPIHSMSFLFELSSSGEHDSSFLKMVEDESQSLSKYLEFASRAETIKTRLKATLDNYRSQGMKVVGYGAAAKGNTLLNYMNYKLDYIVDDNPLKQGYLTPGMDIPIVPPKQVSQESKPVAILVLAWNFFEEIRQRIAETSEVRHVFVRYFPDVAVNQ